MSGSDFGGIMYFRASTGENVALRGSFTCYPARQSVEGIVNQDGTPDRVITPTAPRAEITFADKDIDLATLMEGERRNVTIIEDTTGVSHLFNDAFYTGEPATNRINGEVTGVGIMAASYRKLS